MSGIWIGSRGESAYEPDTQEAHHGYIEPFF